ncbi:MAG TPA: hypothetical protein VFJ58_24320 [Armatimonadota bacterium]|nr:hypothetical protein [Armatimonadota bacterium]
MAHGLDWTDGFNRVCSRVAHGLDWLERDSVYLTEWGRELFEADARRNLERSINRLENASCKSAGSA